MMIIEEVWNRLVTEAEKIAVEEPLLGSYVYSCILNHRTLCAAQSFILANKISDDVMPAVLVRELFDDAYCQRDGIIEAMAYDIKAVYDRDPAVTSYLSVLLYLKGFQAIQVHRLAHYLWSKGRKELALFIQSRNSEVLCVDIHPACRIGKGVMFDHATGIVIGETAVVEDNVSLLQGVTLGGTGNESGDRHPKVRSGVMIGAGAKVLGNIEIGMGAKIGAGSVVLDNVEPHTTVVGVPAKKAGVPESYDPCNTMEQNFLKDSSCKVRG